MSLAHKQRIMSGMRTTAKIHIGNYYGALRNWVKLQNSGEYQCFFGAMNWHAMTDAYKNPTEIDDFTRDIIADWIAWGIDPEKSTIFIQSQVPQHLELHMIFSNLTPMGWLERVTTWKDSEEENKKKDAHNLGRFAYPVLQTADIAIYRGTHVPVGKDQIPHLELSREIIRRCNSLYKLNLPEPQQIMSDVPLLAGTDGRKMSKSYGNVFPLTEEEKAVKKLVNKMVTDPQRVTIEDPGDPDVCPLFVYHKLYSNDEDLKWVREGCTKATIGCGHCKARLAERVNETMAEPREKKRELLENKAKLDSIIHEGCERARKEANITLAMVREGMGIKGFEF